MPITFSNLSQKQIVLAVMGILVLCILLVLLGNIYGQFLKTQVAVPVDKKYSADGSLTASTLPDPGEYTLTFHGQDASGTSVETTSKFEVVSPTSLPAPVLSPNPTETDTPTPTLIPTPTITPVPTSSPAPSVEPSVEPSATPSPQVAL